MAQTWQLGVQAVRPGTYFRVSSGDVTTVGAVNGIVACVIQTNWGKLNKVIEVDQSQMNNLREMFGTGAGVEAIKQALLGGATRVKVVRVGDSASGYNGRASVYSTRAKVQISATKDASSGSVELANVGKFSEYHAGEETVVKATYQWLLPTKDYSITKVKTSDGKSYTSFKIVLTETGKAKLGPNKLIWIRKTYEAAAVVAARIYSRCYGARDFTYSIKKNLLTGKKQLTVYDGTQVFDSVEFPAGGDEAQALVDALKTNANFLAAKKASGELAETTGRKITGGKNPTINVASYSKAFDLLERHYWNVLITDKSTQQVRNIQSEFIKQSYETGHLGMTVMAGTGDESLEERLKFATALNDWRIVYLLRGWKGTDGTDYGGWKAAARLGGMIAACETNASLTHIVISNAAGLLESLSNGEMIQAEEKGCLVLSLNESDQVWIDNAINSLITLGNDMDEGWKKIRRTKCRFELMTRVNRTCDKLIGRLNNDANGRATLLTAMQGIINEMIAEGKLFFGSFVSEDERYKPVGDRAYFLLTIGDIDSVEKIYLDFNFSYANPFE